MKREQWKDMGASGCSCRVLSGLCSSWKFLLMGGYVQFGGLSGLSSHVYCCP